MSKKPLPKVTHATRPGVRTEITDQAMARWNPDVRAAEADEASISILDVIGEDFWSEGVTARRVAAQLDRAGDRPVTVLINSPGGDFFEGLAIYNVLREHNESKGRVTVKVLGIAASAASIIAMAGAEVLIARAGFLMIHNTWVMAAGDRHGLRDVAEWLEPFDQSLVTVYAARTGADDAAVADMLDRETWIGGEAAVEQGFADGLLASDQIDAVASNTAELSPRAAQKKLDLALASGKRMSRSEARALMAAAKSGKPGAARDGKPGAAVAETAQAVLETLKSF